MQPGWSESYAHRYYLHVAFCITNNKGAMADESSIDRSAFSVSSFSEAEEEDKAYWLSRTPQERLVALEKMRQINYAYDPVSDRIQRTLEVAERP